ncbi:tRNA-specific adenosine deaminase [Halomonas elongata]|uniref:tRNA-specific adenosine deaminase n=1 Tax=Halomonas elongata TaxID=2746 RepID=A0A1B8P5S6_HALEL|nr:tRNA-specific adenosine deaminase [Halomonas elongata]
MRSDEYYMHRAMDQARRAEAAGEVPVGAVVVDRAGEIVGLASTRRSVTMTPVPTPRFGRCAMPVPGLATIASMAARSS